MRAQRPISREEEEAESVFVPMTDMVVSFLFIMMLLLAFFAVKYDTQDTVPKADFVREQEKVVAAEKKIGELNLRIDSLLLEIANLKRIIDKLRVRLDEKDAKITDLEEQVTERDKNIEELNLRIDDLFLKISNLEKIIDELRAKLDEKDEKISDLEKEVAERDELIKELEETLARLMKDRTNPLELYVQSSREARQDILKEIEAQLREEFQSVFTEQNILVEVKGDALRFKGQGLFADNSSTLTGDKLRIVRRLGDITLDAIQCYTVNSLQTEYESCNPNGVVVEAIQIEGHTDARGSNDGNLGLSTGRANSALFAMQAERQDILDFRNLLDQPVASVAGYGEMRPTAPDTPENRGENRRIDLRIIMYTPGSVSEVLKVQEKIRNNLLRESEELQ